MERHYYDERWGRRFTGIFICYVSPIADTLIPMEQYKNKYFF
jgi:hypothetical protein